MPTLTGRVKSPRRVTEKSFEDAFAKALRRRGLANHHMTCREAGWPDRYVAGGIWIEFKSLERLSNDQLEPEQKGKMRELAAGGDHVWYCARFENSVILCRYPFDKPLDQQERFAYRTGADLDQLLRYRSLTT